MQPTFGNGTDSVAPIVTDHKLFHRIGHGSYGEVWLAQNVIGVYRAVKIVFRAQFEDGRPYEREFKGIQKFEPISRSHDGLVDVLQVGRNDQLGYFYYVMELADDLNAEGGTRRPECELTTNTGSNSPSALSAGPSIVPAALVNLDAYAPHTLREELRCRGRLGPTFRL